MYARCSYCQMRAKLTKLPEHYLRLPRCKGPGCWAESKRKGRPQRWYIDRYRMLHERGRFGPRPCKCGEPMTYNGETFPHRRGSGFCRYNPNITEEMYRDRCDPDRRF